MSKLSIALVGIVVSTSVARAQPNTISVNVATTASVYAQTQIELAPGFSTETGGFEAKLVLPYASAGQWSSPLPWTPFVRQYQMGDVNIQPPGRVGMVGIHTHVLPNGKVLTWEGHNAKVNYDPTLVMETHAYLWDSDPAVPYPNNYKKVMNMSSDLFCSGHTFLPDGRLMVVGGHEMGNILPTPDFQIDPTTVYDQQTDTYPGYPSGVPFNTASDYIGLKDFNLFSYNAKAQQPEVEYWQSSEQGGPDALPPMQFRRWYPTATTLSTGEVLVTSGQRYGGLVTQPNGGPGPAVLAEQPEVWNPATGQWRTLTTAIRRQPLYPWMFQAPDGRVFDAGPEYQTQYLNTSSSGAWTPGPERLTTTYREYGAAVMYEPGKLIIIGGGNNDDNITNTTELLNLNVDNPAFRVGPDMVYPRRHVNGTLLPDGTVLASGGTTTIDDPTDAHAVLPAELWTPPTSLHRQGYWSTMNSLSVARSYHSTAVLLPDGRVLTAGQGQGGGFTDHPDYQVYSPPYLFRGPRPQLTQAPTQVAYGQQFVVTTPTPNDIYAVNWVRLSSVTHSFNMNQRLNHLSFVRGTGSLTLTAPSSADDCPPGQYMLFLLTGYGVPSVARVVTIGPTACLTTLSLTQQTTSSTACTAQVQVTAGTSSPVTSYRWVVDGTSYPQYDGQSSIPLSFGVEAGAVASRESPSAPAANVGPPGSSGASKTITVTVTPTCGGQALTKTKTVTLYFPYCNP